MPKMVKMRMNNTRHISWSRLVWPNKSRPSPSLSHLPLPIRSINSTLVILKLVKRERNFTKESKATNSRMYSILQELFY